MTRDEDEILFAFFTLLHKIRDVLLVNRPDLLDLFQSKNFKLIQDPFGRYFQIVLFIGQRGRCSMSEFASYFNLKGGTATGMIDQLVERNLIARVSNPQDRRKVELVLTELGAELFRKALEIQRDEIRGVLDVLNGEDIQHLKHILNKINKALVIKKREGKKEV